MCGIVGIVNRTGAPVSQEELDRAIDAVAHRGPDGRGTFRSGNVGLGHRRLAIVDLSEGGLQPMHSQDGALSLIFNGEIYNHLELREELRTRGHAFRTSSDSEVILAAYAEWGPDCVRRFNGMWAFAIHDRLENRLVLSRDRFGVKPLFYVDEPAVFAFGSEIGQLLAYLPSRRTDPDRVKCFLLTGGLDLDEGTFFEGVRKIPAGTSAIYDLKTDLLTIVPYYALEPHPEYEGLGEQEALARFTALLEDAVRLRLRSDVLVGTCLSGGLDSSSIATIASQLNAGTSAPFHAITAISEDLATDETPFAARLVENSHLNWIRVKPSYADFRESLPDIVASQQEPFGGPSLTMQYFVMKAARDHGIKVLLDGQGGDETLLGYEKYYYTFLRQQWRHAGLQGVLEGLASIRVANGRLGPAGIARYVLGARLPSIRMAGHRREMPFLKGAASMPDHIAAFARHSGSAFRLQKLELEKTNLPVLLRYEDRNSMWHGVEARLPFLDFRLVELSLSLPASFKIRQGWTKWILRKAMQDRMPRDVTWRRNKYSFNAPDAIWLKIHADEMKSAVAGSDLLASVCDFKALTAGFQDLPLRSQWRLYSVALWQKAFGIVA